MSQSKIEFYDVADVEKYMEDHFDTCPNENPTSLDLLVMLSQMHPNDFSQALFDLDIEEESFNAFLETVLGAVISNNKDAGIEPDVGQLEFTDELRGCFDAIEHSMAQNPAQLLDGEERGFNVTDILNFTLKNSDSMAGILLDHAQKGLLDELKLEDLEEAWSKPSVRGGINDFEAIFMSSIFGMGADPSQKKPGNWMAVVGGGAQQPEEEAGPDDASNFLKNITAEAKESGFEAVIGRDTEISQAVRTLLRKEKRNPIFVGSAGVGKTSIAYAIAQKVADGDVPEELQGRDIVSMDLAAMVAGAKYRGDFEKRIKNVLEHVKKTNAILFIDEIHMICGAGAASGAEKMDASNILKTYLSDQKNPISVMGATTFDEFKILEKDGALERRISKLVINEPSNELAMTMIEGKRAAYEAHHSGVKLSDEAIVAAVEYSARHIHDRCLPDKALDILDSALAAQRDGFVPESGTKGVIGESDVVAQLSRQLGRDIGVINDPKMKEKLATMTERFNAAVINQKQAINKVVDRVMNSEAGLFADARKNKTLGAFMFAGKTGVGKTELSQQLAKELGVPLIRYDMSEYQEATAYKRLTGADPGYVGYDEGGQLVNDIRENPSCVLLLDEIEKAHPSVYKVLLQVLDNAKIKDGQGRVADFQNVYVVMTSNIGATLEEIRGIGFNAKSTTVETQRADMIKQVFSPEFVGRMDDIVEFNDLDNVEDFVKILDIHLQPQIDGLKDKGIKVKFDQSAKEFIADVAMEQKLGARPAKKAIEDYFQKPLVKAFCEGALGEGYSVTVKAPKNDNDEALDIRYRKPAQKRLPAPKATA